MDREQVALTNAIKEHTRVMKDLTRVLAAVNQNLVSFGQAYQKDQESQS